MPLNPAGSNPIINARFGGIELGTCTIFIKKAGIITWTKIETIDNSTFASHNIVLNPSKYLDAGSSIGDLVGADIRYNILFLDTNGDNQITCSFDLEITQDGAVIHSQNDSTNQNVASILFSHTFTL